MQLNEQKYSKLRVNNLGEKNQIIYATFDFKLKDFENLEVNISGGFGRNYGGNMRTRSTFDHGGASQGKLTYFIALS